MQIIRRGGAEGKGSQSERDGIWKLQRELDQMKGEMESIVSNTVKNVTEDVDITLEMKRWKGNLIIHRMSETDVEQDVEAIAEMLTNVMHMDFARNVEKTERIGRLVGVKPGPLRIVLNRVHAKKETSSRLKMWKDVEGYKKIIISPDLTRKH